MDRNSSLERRYSFNTAQSYPVAESTQLNGSSFCWGSSMSPKQRSNSSICLNDAQNDSSRNILTSLKSKNVTKIDARIVADVHSKGLVSRIVKYHESGSRLNRSMSAHNLYSKPGQFPVVTLKKTDLPYRATKQNLSMTRIAPPEKSIFYGNTLSSLLRSNSVVGLQKSNEDISRDRPILHPPPTENDMAPTRSVLDVLKEISRKRINSDDLDTTEASKKYCNRGSNDLVDTGGINSSYSNLPKPLTQSGKSFKRQRDINASYQSIHIQESRTSPEQAKKRICNYNNDITSSLSSSKKCKSYEQKRPSYYLNQTMPTNLEAYETQKAKIIRYHAHNSNQAELRFDNLANNLRNVDTIKPITPIPATPCTQDQSSNGVVPQRTISEPLYKQDDSKPMLNLVHPANKPRLTLFNKNYDVNTEKTDADSVAEQDDDNVSDTGECAGIQFVKPKKLNSKTGIKNVVIERTQKSKLALMLSGLRGELYQTSDLDELDSSKIQENTKIVESNNNTQITTIISTPKAISTSTTTLTTVTSTISPNNGFLTESLTKNSTTTSAKTPTTATNSTISTTEKSHTNTTSSPLVGLKLTPQKSKIENSFSLNPGSISNKNASEPHYKPNVPVLGGFSFGTTPNLTAALATTTTNSSPKVIPPTTSPKPSAVEGFATFPKLPSTTNANVNNTTTLINFGTTLAKENCNSVSISAVSVAPTSFSIATCTPSASINLTSNTSNTSTFSKPIAAFSFGASSLVSASATSVPTQISGSGLSDTATKPNAGLNFGISSTTTSTASSVLTPAVSIFGSSPAAAAVTTTNTATSSTLGFNSNTTATPSSGVPESSMVAITTSNSLTSTSFSFGTPSGQSTTPTTNSSSAIPTGGFSFGSNSTFAPNNSTAIKPQTTSSSTTASFSFGSATTYSNAVQSPLCNNNSSVFNSTGSKDNTSVFNTESSSLFEAPQPAFGKSTSGSFFGSTATNSVQNIFGTSNAISKSLFGTGSSNSSTQAFGSVADNKTTSVFGSNSTSITSTPFGFGSKSTNKPIANPSSTPSGGFSFGSAAFGVASNQNSAANTSNSATNHSFGTMSSSGTVLNKTFAFGSSNNKSENNSTNVFGASTNKQSETIASPSGFSIGSANAKPSCSSSFSFASSGNMPTSNISSNAPSTGFTFGAGAPSKPTDISDNKPFSFGTSPSPTPQSLGVPNNNASSSNIFASAPAAKNVPPAFNFGASTNAQSTGAPSTNNIFAPHTSNMSSGPGDRPIRRATRRLQK